MWRVVSEHSAEWLREELINVDLEVQQYLDTYHMSTAGELEQAIRSGQVGEHPAWEDLIGWEVMEDYRQKLEAELAALDAREGRGSPEATPGPQGSQGASEAGTPE